MNVAGELGNDRWDEPLRMVRWLAVAALLQAAVLLVLDWILPGFSAAGPGSILLVAAVLTVLQAAVWPFAYRVVFRVHPLLFPAISFTLAGLIIVFVGDLLDAAGAGGITVDGIGTGMLVAFVLTAGTAVLGAIFSLHDDGAYEWFVVGPIQRRFANAPRTDTPGILFLEIDGLAEPILRRALAAGYLPTLQRWLVDGSHRITSWEPDLSSQTSASQAGILLGDNTGIPAFRWYDKAAGGLKVSSSIATARYVEHRLANGDGLLRSGASRWNMFSGEAPDCLFTYSTFGDSSRRRSGGYFAYFANPYLLPRTIALYLLDVCRERWQAWRQARTDERPRIHRGFRYAFVRAATTTVMQEAALFMLIVDTHRGVPEVYTTFYAYDEVAHHSGIYHPDAMKVLRTLDRELAILERAVRTAPRPYHLVVLSDHGQSVGATFEQRFGRTLGNLVTSLVHPEARVLADHRGTEDWGHLNLALSEALRDGGDKRTARLVRRALQPRMSDDLVNLGPTGEAEEAKVARDADASDVVVLASGNLGLVSFPRWPERLTYEQIVDTFPNLIPGLISHPGIGFVMVHSASDGGMVIGAEGVHYLEHAYAVGIDPLAAYGPNAARHLQRTDGFYNAPDLLVMSAYNPITEEVNAFEEKLGSHGGLGGPQTHPFVLHPVTLDPGPEPIVGAAALHQVLRRWRPRCATERPL